MREKIIIRRKCAYKQQRGYQLKKKSETIEKIQLEREVQNLEKTNNAPMAISLESTVGSCWVFDILLFSHSSTNWPEVFDVTQSGGQKSSLELSWKTKGNTPVE